MSVSLSHSLSQVNFLKNGKILTLIQIKKVNTCQRFSSAHLLTRHQQVVENDSNETLASAVYILYWTEPLGAVRNRNHLHCFLF